MHSGNDEPIKEIGLKVRTNQDGDRRYYWFAPKEATRLGYEPTCVRIAGSDHVEAERALIVSEAQRLNADALAWLDEHRSGGQRFDGSLAALIRCYQIDQASPYVDLKWNTRRTYDQTLSIIERSFGKRALAALRIEDFRRWYAEAKKPRQAGGSERVRKAHGIITMLRRLFAYGVTAEIAQCERLDQILSRARFKQPSPSRQKMTLQHLEAFIPVAEREGRLSLAIGTALQFESTFRQRDVIGEWEPLKPAEVPSGIVLNRRRWVNGLTWGDIRPDWTVEKATTKTGQFVGHDLKLYPIAFGLLQKIPEERRVGPLIIDEAEGRPYAEHAYAREWRAIARAADIPNSVWNMHARAGGISEADDAGADLDLIGHQSAQSQRSTTARYVRGTIGKTRKVAEMRLAHRESLKNAE